MCRDQRQVELADSRWTGDQPSVAKSLRPSCRLQVLEGGCEPRAELRLERLDRRAGRRDGRNLTASASRWVAICFCTARRGCAASTSLIREGFSAASCRYVLRTRSTNGRGSPSK